MQKNPLLPIFLIVLVDILGMTIILPLLPFYAEHLGAAPSVVGLLISTYGICQLISGPILGRLSDRMGRRPLLLVSQLGTFIGFIVLANARVLWVVFLARVIDGSTAGNLSLAQAYIADVTEAKNRARSFGVIGIAFGIGFLIGPAFSALLYRFGYAYPIYAAACLSATSIACTYFILPRTIPGGDHPPHESRTPSALRLSTYSAYFARPGLRSLLWQFFLFSFSFATFVSGFALFAQRRYTWHGKEFGPEQVGYVFAYLGLLGIILQGALLGRLVKALGERKLVWTGFLSWGIGTLWMGLSWRISSLLGAATVASFGSGVLRPSLTSLITQRAGPREQGAVLGITQSLFSIAQILAPPLAGFLIGQKLLVVWAITASIPGLLGFLVSFGTRHAAELQSTPS